MSGLKLKIPTTFTNPALPYLRDDPVLPKQGAMMLIDPTHPAGGWAAGVPVNGDYVPNIAESQALAMMGGTPNDVRLKMRRPGTFAGSAGTLERTTKGGLHGIVSQVNANVPLQSGPVLAMTNPFMAYILAHRTHSYYISLWMRLTRQPAAGYDNSAVLAINGNGQQTNSYLFHIAPDGASNTNYNRRPNGAPALGVREDPIGSELGNKFLSVGTSRWWSAATGYNDSVPGDGTNVTLTGNQAGGGLPWGPAVWNGIGSNGVTADFGVFSPPGSNATTNKDKCASHIIYRFYMEDLTVSGRSYEAVDALSWAEYQKHVLTPGGRYYGDTFTDPATIP